jgi:SAM-dependent methyltransferase
MPQKPSEWNKRFALQAGWTSDTRRYLFDLAGVSSATSVLDVGCGTGVITSLAADLGVHLPIGIDINKQFIELASKQVPAAKFTIADAHHLPFKQQVFDASFCHFVLMWVADPLIVLKQIARVTRSGSAIFALAEPDYGGRIDFPAELEVIGNWQSQSLQEQGADPVLGRKLRSLFHQAGLVDIEVGVIGAQWHESPDENTLESEWDVIQHDLAYLEKEKSDLHEKSDKIRDLDLKAWAAGERVLYVPTFYAWGRVPG